MTIAHTIGVGGLVHQNSPLDVRDLPATSGQSSAGVVSIPLVDVLAAMHVDASAEILVATDPTGASLAIPIRQIVAIETAHIRFERQTDHPDGVAGRAAGPWLVVPTWTDASEPFHLVGLRAVTFMGFLNETSR